MKYTVFQFVLRLAQNQPGELLPKVVATIEAVKGVKEATTESNGSSVVLRVHASFPSGTVAKRLHRKIMTALMNLEGVSIAQVTSNLTDVFGE